MRCAKRLNSLFNTVARYMDSNQRVGSQLGGAAVVFCSFSLMIFCCGIQEWATLHRCVLSVGVIWMRYQCYLSVGSGCSGYQVTGGKMVGIIWWALPLSNIQGASLFPYSESLSSYYQLHFPTGQLGLLVQYQGLISRYPSSVFWYKSSVSQYIPCCIISIPKFRILVLYFTKASFINLHRRSIPMIGKWVCKL